MPVPIANGFIERDASIVDQGQHDVAVIGFVTEASGNNVSGPTG